MFAPMIKIHTHTHTQLHSHAQCKANIISQSKYEIMIAFDL